MEHALQITEIAIKNNETEEFQLTCFLHDIGHLLLDEHNENSEFLTKDKYHETIGYKYLTSKFKNTISRPILLHVLAKRYLCIKIQIIIIICLNRQKSFHLQWFIR